MISTPVDDPFDTAFITALDRDLKAVFEDLGRRYARGPGGEALLRGLADACRGGKRFRACLLAECWRCVRRMSGREVPPVSEIPVSLAGAGAAVEMVHGYSLVHDDLPAMDNSPTRRGRPSAHVEHGEAQAILIGDILLALAFARLARLRPVDIHDGTTEADRCVELLAEGSAAMAWGQAQEFQDARSGSDVSGSLDTMEKKTGALIGAAAAMGAVLGGAGADVRDGLHTYGVHLGVVFQLRDDQLDDTGSQPPIPATSVDEATNFVRRFGVGAAQEAIERHHAMGLRALRRLWLERNAVVVGEGAQTDSPTAKLESFLHWAATRAR